MKFLHLCLLSGLLSAIPFVLHATEIRIEPQSESPVPQFVIKADRVEKLAGMKLVLTYPKEHIGFADAKKGEQLNNFMHVTNDKNPGQLILVMASATGISGEDLTLFTLTFQETASSIKGQYYPSLKSCELMSEMLTPIECKMIHSTATSQ